MSLPPMDMAASRSSRGAKRPADESSDDDEPRPKKGFVHRVAGAFQDALSPSSPGDIGLSASQGSPSPSPFRGGQLSAPNRPTSPPPITDAERDAIIAQARIEAGPMPTDPAEREQHLRTFIDLVGDKLAARWNTPRFGDSRFNLNINQHDKAWTDKRNFFVNELKDPTKTPYEIFEANFDRAQVVCLIPPDRGPGANLNIQQEHTKEYKEALGSTGRFRGVLDNLATKLTMLFFGLPIEPITLNNVEMASEEGDKDCPEDGPQEAPKIKGHKRSRGCIILRRAKQKNLAAPTALRTLSTNASTTSLQHHTNVATGSGGGEHPATVVPGATATPTGGGSATEPAENEVEVGAVPAPIPPAGRGRGGRGRGGRGRGGRGRARRVHNDQQAHRRKSFINRGQFAVSLRGGALPDLLQDEDDTESASDLPTKNTQSLLEEVPPNVVYGCNGTAVTDRNTRNLQTPEVPTRMNKERIMAAAAGKAKPRKWSDWMTEQHFQDQSVIEPGRMPAPPLCSPSRELQLQLRVGSSMPTIYVERLTPTDIKQLQDENRKLRNHVLDQMFVCPICDEDFETYDREDIRAHCREHQKQLEEVGQCPSCGNHQWAFMTNDEKRMHLETHHFQHESAKIKNFYHDQHCPVCDRDLSKMKPEHAIRHCLEHAPGQLQYCERCGLDKNDCNTEELRHHHRRCHLAHDRKAGDPEPVFCSNCGRDITRVSPEENREHLEHCRKGPAGRFCTKCGLDETAHHWDSAAIDKHDSHCMPPSGFKRKFCEKCRTELGSLDAVGILHHQQTCHLVEPAVPSDQSRMTELKQRQDSREAMLAKKEKDVEQKISLYKALKLDVEKLKQAQAGGHEPTDDDDDFCPIPLCSQPIPGMSKAAFVNHIRTHRDNELAPRFTCPLENATGDRCNDHLSLGDDGFDLTVHYKHMFSGDEEAAVANSVLPMSNEFKELRALIRAAQSQLTSDAAFIAEASLNLEIPLTPEPVSSTQAQKTAEQAPDFHIQHRHHLPPAAVTTPAAAAAKEKPTPKPSNSANPANFSSYQPPTVTDSREDDIAVDEAGVFAELQRWGKGVDTAVSTRAAKKARKEVAAPRRRASVSQQSYIHISDDDFSSSMADAGVLPIPLKKKGRTTKASPEKGPAVGSKKRKQEDVAEETVPSKTVQKTQNQVPVKKKQKKTEDRIAEELPKRASGTASATPAKKAGKPKAKREKK